MCNEFGCMQLLDELFILGFEVLSEDLLFDFFNKVEFIALVVSFREFAFVHDWFAGTLFY